MEIVKISPSAYQLHDPKSSLNLGFVVTDDGVVLIDSGSSAEMVASARSRVREVTDQPIVYAINTHFHADHTLGNSGLDAPILAHQCCYDEMDETRLAHMRERGPEVLRPDRGQGTEAIRLPTLSFTRDAYIYLAGTLLHLAHTPGHTAGSVVVNLPAERVIFASDTVFVDAPPPLEGADPVQWQQSIRRLSKLEPAKILPGRGRIAGPEDLEPLFSFLESKAATIETPEESADACPCDGRLIRLPRCRERTLQHEDHGSAAKRLASR